MHRRRFLLNGAAASLTASALAACDSDVQVAEPAPKFRLHIARFPGRQQAEARVKKRMAAKGVRYGAPIHLMAFKREQRMEVWGQGDDGTFNRIATYQICMHSGRLGPKVKEGDHQTPEGFYEITPNLMNPWSSYHLGIDIGYPNHYDRSKGRTGSFLAIHGACRSIGCYAMGNFGIEEIYLMLEQAFVQGEYRATLAAYPFRPTSQNLAKMQGHRWEGFWKNIFKSHRLFETTRQPPYYGVFNGSYVFSRRPVGTNSIFGYPVS